MEQRHNFIGFRIDPTEIWAFVEIAAGAGQAKIVVRVVGPVLLGEDVLDVENRERFVLLGESAIFAAIASTVRDSVTP